MPRVPTSNVVPMQSRPQVPLPSINPTYAAMAAATMNEQGRLFERVETDGEYYSRINKAWKEMSEQDLRSIVSEDVERNVMSPPQARAEEYFKLWDEEKEFGEQKWKLSPRKLQERYGSGAKRPR